MWFSLPVFSARVSVMFHLMCVHIIVSSVWLLSGHRLERRCLLGGPHVLCVLRLFAILFISRLDCFSSWSLHILFADYGQRTVSFDFL